MTGNGLSYQVLRDLGVIHSGFTPSAAHYADLLALLNQMLESWSLERLMVYSIARAEHALTAAQSNYTLGPSGADFTAARPYRVDKAGYINFSGGDEEPLEILSLSDWQIQKPGLYVNMDFPLIDLKLRPAPIAGQTLVLYTWEALAAFADGTTAYTFPPGYELALRKGLAVEAIPMMEMYVKVATPQKERLERDAVRAKAAIKRINQTPESLRCDPAMVGSYFDTGRLF